MFVVKQDVTLGALCREVRVRVNELSQKWKEHKASRKEMDEAGKIAEVLKRMCNGGLSADDVALVAPLFLECEKPPVEKPAKTKIVKEG